MKPASRRGEDFLVRRLNERASGKSAQPAIEVASNGLIAVPVGIVIGLGIEALRTRDAQRLADVLLGGISCAVVTMMKRSVAPLVKRRRPHRRLPGVTAIGTGASDSSFFSHHTAQAAALATAALGTSRAAGVTAAVAGAGLGVARVAVGAHYPTDVAAGAVIGLVSSRLALLGRQRLARRLDAWCDWGAVSTS
jgi:undecaprenyl-diphosphatase